MVVVCFGLYYINL